MELINISIINMNMDKFKYCAIYDGKIYSNYSFTDENIKYIMFIYHSKAKTILSCIKKDGVDIYYIKKEKNLYIYITNVIYDEVLSDINEFLKKDLSKFKAEISEEKQEMLNIVKNNMILSNYDMNEADKQIKNYSNDNISDDLNESSENENIYKNELNNIKEYLGNTISKVSKLKQSCTEIHFDSADEWKNKDAKILHENALNTKKKAYSTFNNIWKKIYEYFYIFTISNKSKNKLDNVISEDTKITILLIIFILIIFILINIILYKTFN